VNGEGAPHRLLQPTLRHVHLQRPLDSRCAPRLRGGRLLERTPRDLPGRVALDGAPRASVDSAHAPADPAVTGAPDFLVGSDIGEPSKGRPPFRGVVFRGQRVRIDL
jgi:hypothetical protein